MIKSFRAHPLMIIKLLKPFWFVLVIPLVKGLLQYVIYRRVSGVLTMEAVTFAVIFAIALLRCRAFRLNIHVNRVTVREGIIFVKESVIQISRLSSVSSAQNPLDAILGAVTYTINTEAGARGKPDFEFKLSAKDSHELSALLYGNESRTAIKFSFFKVAALSATTSSSVVGLLISVPVIKKSGDLLGLALSDMLVDEINNASTRINTWFPPVVSVITLFFLLGYLVSFIYSLFRNMMFRLYLGRDKIEVSAGLIVKRRTAFLKEAVNTVQIEQTPLMRIIRRYSMRVSVGGYGDPRKTQATVVPFGKHGDIKKQFSMYFPFLMPDGDRLRAEKSRISRERFMFLPVLYSVITLGASVTLTCVFSYFDRLIVFLTAVALGIILYIADLCLFDYRFGKLCLGENIYVRASRGFHCCEMFCTRENIGVIRITRNPADLLQGTCNITFTVRSESADRIRVKHLKHADVAERLKIVFNTEATGE